MSNISQAKAVQSISNSLQEESIQDLIYHAQGPYSRFAQVCDDLNVPMHIVDDLYEYFNSENSDNVAVILIVRLSDTVYEATLRSTKGTSILVMNFDFLMEQYHNNTLSRTVGAILDVVPFKIEIQLGAYLYSIIDTSTLVTTITNSSFFDEDGNAPDNIEVDGNRTHPLIEYRSDFYLHYSNIIQLNGEDIFISKEEMNAFNKALKSLPITNKNSDLTTATLA